MDICSVYIYFYLHTRKYCFNKLPYQCKEYGRINTSKGIGVNKTNASKTVILAIIDIF